MHKKLLYFASTFLHPLSGGLMSSESEGNPNNTFVLKYHQNPHYYFGEVPTKLAHVLFGHCPFGGGLQSLSVTFTLRTSLLDGSFSPGRGKWAKFVLFSFFLKLHCDQTVWFFKVFQLFWRDYFVWVLFYLKKIRLPNLIAHRAQSLWARCARGLVIFFKIQKKC